MRARSHVRSVHMLRWCALTSMLMIVLKLLLADHAGHQSTCVIVHCLAVQPRCTLLRASFAGILAEALVSAPAPALAAPTRVKLKIPETGKRVVDLGQLITPSVEADLERAIAKMEQDTPYRFRIFTPPPGQGPENKADWADIVKAVGQYWAQEPQWDSSNAVVLLAEPRSNAGKSTNLLNFSVARRLTEQLQYRIASDTFTKIAYRYGDGEFVAKNGEGESIAAAAVNAMACLRKGACMQPLPEDEARNIVEVGGPLQKPKL